MGLGRFWGAGLCRSDSLAPGSGAIPLAPPLEADALRAYASRLGVGNSARDGFSIYFGIQFSIRGSVVQHNRNDGMRRMNLTV